MDASPFQQHWAETAARLGLSVVMPFQLSVDGRTIQFPVLLRSFGSRNGMILVTRFEEVAPYADRLVESGYGYSCLSEPGAAPDDDDDAVLEMLRDWGWSGEGRPPDWLAQDR